MKTILTLLAIILLPCFVRAGGTTTTTSTTPQIDAESAASAFVSQAAASYQGGSYLEQTQIDGSFTWVQSQFTLVNGRITQFRLYNQANPNGVEITIPQGGMPGFPRNKIGETRNFSVWLTGYTEDGTFASYGGYSKLLFGSNDNIAIELRPSDRLKKIAFATSQIPAGVNAFDLVLENENQAGSSSSVGYNQNLGGFWIYVDPLDEGTYTLYDQKTGFVYPFDPTNPSTASQYAGINTTYIGGPVKIDFGGSQNYKDYTQVLLDKVVERNGTFVAAKTYFTDLQGIYGLSISINNFLGKVEIFSIGEDGSKTLVKTASIDPSQSWTTVDLYVGYGPVVITFTGGRSPYFGGSYFRFVQDQNLNGPGPRG